MATTYIIITILEESKSYSITTTRTTVVKELIMNILKNIIPVKSVAGASGNQHFNNDLNDDEDDGFVLVDDHVPNQASYCT